MANQESVENIFKPEDFKTLFFADQSCPTDAAELANAKFKRWLNLWPLAYLNWNGNLPYELSFHRDKNQTHGAHLALIQQLPTEPCKHEPNEVEITMNYEGGIYSPRLGTFDIQKLGSSKFKSLQSICKHCGVELQAEWSEKK